MGVYVSARMDLSYFICGRIRNCQPGGVSASFMSVWNPAEKGTEEEFYDAFIQMVQEVGERLGNPHMGITMEDIDFFFVLSGLNKLTRSLGVRLSGRLFILHF